MKKSHLSLFVAALALPLCATRGVTFYSGESLPVIEWGFDDEFGNSATPLAKTAVTGIPLNVAGAPLAEPVPGVEGSAWKFREIPAGTVGGLLGVIPKELTQFTVHLSLKLPEGTEAKGNQYVFGIAEKLFLRWTPAHRLEAGVVVPGQGWKEVAASVDPSLYGGSWVTVSVQYDGQTLAIAMDGRLIESAPVGALTIPAGSRFVVGACPWDPSIDHFSGSLDHLQLLALAPPFETPTQIKGKLVNTIEPFEHATKSGSHVSYRDGSLKIGGNEMRAGFALTDGLLLAAAVSVKTGKNLIDSPTKIFLIERKGQSLASDSLNVTGLKAWVEEDDAVVEISLISLDGELAAKVLLRQPSDGPAEWRLQLTNAGDQPERIQASFPILDGVRPTEKAADAFLFYPSRGGLCGPGNYAIQHEYGLLCSFQLMSVFARDGSEQVYAFTDDREGSFRGLAIHKRDDKGQTRKMGFPPVAPAIFSSRLFSAKLGTGMAFCNPWLTVEPGKDYISLSAKIGWGAGDWRPGFTAYSAWLKSWLKTHPMPESLVDSFRFIAQHPSAFLDDKAKAYIAFDLRRGPEHVFQWAFWEKFTPSPDMPFANQMTKFQTGDYLFNPAKGGAPALRDEIQKLQSAGSHVQLYINSRMCSELSIFGGQHGAEVAELAKGGRYGYDEKWVASAAEEKWINHLLSVCERVVKEVNPDGIYLDEQPMLYPSYKTADGWAPGKFVDTSRFVSLIEGYRQIIKANNPKAHLMIEHYSDFFSQYADCGWDQTTFIASRTTDPAATGFEATFPGLDELDAYRLNFFRFLVPHLKLAEWGGESRMQIARAVFNGIGSCGANAGNEPDYFYVSGEAMKELGEAFSSESAEPLVPTLNENILANRFIGNPVEVWTLFNRSRSPVDGSLIKIPLNPGERLVETIQDEEISTKPSGKDQAVVSLQIKPDDVAVIAKFQRTLSFKLTGDNLEIDLPEKMRNTAVRMSVFEKEDRTGFRGAKPLYEANMDQSKGPVIIRRTGEKKLIVKLTKDGQLIDSLIIAPNENPVQQ